MTITTVGELIEMLSAYDDETPVMLAHQPNWPLAETIATVTHRDDTVCDVECPIHEDYLVGHGGCDAEPEDPEGENGGDVVWLVAGGHAWDCSPYAPRWVFDGVPS